MANHQVQQTLLYKMTFVQAQTDNINWLITISEWTRYIKKYDYE